MSRVLRFFFCAGAIAVPILGQSTDETKYRELLTRAEQGDVSADSREMRFRACAFLPARPRSTPAELAAVAATKDPKEILRLCELQLAQGFVNLEVQAIRVAAYQQMGDTSSTARYLDVVTRMSGSILRGKDGKTPQTAYEVISDREILATLALLGLGDFARVPGGMGIQDGQAGSH